MPLKTVANIGSFETYKKLIKTDAAALQQGAGVAFQAFTKFTFPDKTASAVIIFGLVPPACTEAVKTGGKGKATGTATINAADEIELEIASGDVDYPALSLALGKSGVTRKLRVPLAPLTPGNGATTPKIGVKPTTAPQAQMLGRRPVPSPTTKPQVPPPTGNAPTGNKPPTTGVPPVPLRKPVLPPLKTPTTAPQPTTGPQTVPTTGNKPTTPPPQNRPPISPKTAPTGPRPIGPMGPNPGAQTEPKAPNNKPLQKPLSPEEKEFRAHFASLKPRYDIALSQDPTNKGLQSTFAGMLQTAKSGDFKGALLDSGKLEFEVAKVQSVISKAEFQKNKAARQERRSARLAESFDAVKKSYFTPGSADRLAKEKLEAGTHFKAFLKAQKAFETKRDENTLNALEQAATSYRAHYGNDFNDKDKQKPENVRKESICATALTGVRHYRLALEKDKLGGLPWDDKTEMKAAELYTKLLFEQDEDKVATPNAQGSAVNGAFWIEKELWPDEEKAAKDGKEAKKVKRTFIFKPGDAEGLVPGYPRGGSAARELLGKTVGDQLQSMMGLSFDVPETTVVAVDSSKLPDQHGKVGPLGVPRSGSIQHFANVKGELKSMREKDPNILNTIPDDEVQTMAILDFVQLNTDRHDGNFMVGERDNPKGGKSPRLVPIDNGLCMPSLEGLRSRRNMLIPPHAVVGLTPAGQKKLPPEMVAKVQQIDPEAVVAGMKKSFTALQSLHPDAANAAKISDEHFNLTTRSILFLKKAASELTLAEIQDAYSLNLEEIFESAPDQMEAEFDKVIKEAKARTPAINELAPLIKTLPDVEKMQRELRRLGWGTSVGDKNYDRWARSNPEKVMKIYKNKMENPAALKKLAQMKKDLAPIPPDVMAGLGKGPGADIVHLGTLNNKKHNERALAYGEPASQMNGDRVDIYESLGGDAKLRELGTDPTNLKLDERVKLIVKKPMMDLGGDVELAKLVKALPLSRVKTVGEKYQALKDWKEYNALGGDNLYFRNGGDPELQQVGMRLAELRSMLEPVP